MPGPVLGQGRTFEAPPQGLMDRDRELYDYLFMIHARLFGIGKDTTGDLDLQNINDGIIPKIPQGHDATTHNSLVQAQAVTDFVDTDEAVETALEITSVDATGIYGAPERDLINEIKNDLNSLFTEYDIAIGVINVIEAKLNELLDSLRAATIIAPDAEV